MPSKRHEGIVLLFRENPSLAVELLREALGAHVPAHTDARLASETVRQPSPVEVTADAVILLTRGSQPVLAIIVEAQLRSAADKHFTWPVYLTVVRREHRCPVVILIVAPDERTARAAERPIFVGPGSVVRPVVIGPSRIPRIVDERVAREHVELAVLSALAHGRDDSDLEVVLPTIAALRGAALDEERSRIYADLVVGALGNAARLALEAHMKSGRYEYVSWFAKKYVAEGEARGRAEGEARGRAEGEARGRAEGEARGLGEAVLAVLAAREIAVSPEAERRVRACRDSEQLERWLRRAAVAKSADEVFHDG